MNSKQSPHTTEASRGSRASARPRIVAVSGEALGEMSGMVPGVGGAEHETKFSFDARFVGRVLGLLRARCRPDTRYPEGIVRSIYYDSHRWAFVGEKLNSDFLKTKVRLRSYARPQDGTPLGHGFLEAKFKFGSCRRKLRIETDWSAEHIAQLALEGPELALIPELLTEADSGFQGPLPGPLLPVFEIEYRRRRFVEPRSRARLSIDTEIRVSRVNSTRLPPARELAFPRAVLEVKGDSQDLPVSLRELKALGCEKEAFSKYGTCFQWLDRAVI